MMPSADDWRIVPLRAVSGIFEKEAKGRREAGEEGRESWTSRVTQFFRDKLSAPEWRRQIPDLETAPNHELVDGQIVRFRCMIQDMFDPEYYFSEYKVKHLSTGVTRVATGRYRDFADNGPREEILHDTAVTAERQMLYCISVPGEAPWARLAFSKTCPSTSTPSVSNPVRIKRPAEGEGNDDDAAVESMDVEVSAKKARGDARTATAAAEGEREKQKKPGGGECPALNFPIPGAKGHAAIVKVYDVDDGTFSLNDVVEFVGVVSLNPALAQVPLEGCDAALNQFDEMEEELAAKNPPASLVPRLHVLTYSKLSHGNPLLPQEVSLANRSAVREEAAACRNDLHAALSAMLLGDALAAEYLICHLVSRIYHRRDGLCLGKFSLNLFNVPLHNGYSRRVCAILQQLLTKSHYLPLTVDNLNSLVYVPKKDYHANRLVAGLLQLSPNTHLMLDETTVENGQLGPEGVRNLTAVGTVISWQRVEYNFNYHQIEFPTDIPCLVLSEGRSMLPNDVDVMLRPRAAPTPSSVESELASANSGLGAEFLDRMRRYLTVVRLISEYDLTDDLQKEVQEDFVAERRARAQQQQQQQIGGGGRVAMTTDDLHAHLVLARSIGISKGEFTLTKDTWEKTKSMERQRKERVAHLPPRRAARADAAVAVAEN